MNKYPLAYRTLAVTAGFSGFMSGVEVALEHYRGSYGQRIMYSPVVLSALLGLTGLGAAVGIGGAVTLLPVASWILILDGVLGFGFHIRGISRKPGGWRMPVSNIVMGPPIFAPLLLPIGGVLGWVASRLMSSPANSKNRTQTVLYGVVSVSALLNGFEALYSHYKANFSKRSQWIPVILAPLVAAVSFSTLRDRRLARVALPAVSVVGVGAGFLGSLLHLRGTLKRPGFKQHQFYNLVYGPPVLAPILFSATGFMGLLACYLERQGEI